MLTQSDLVAAARAAQKIPSNAALSRLLGVPERTVARWHTNKHTPDDVTAAKLAELAGLDVDEVLASMAAARATGEARALWERLADRLHATGMAALAVILSLWIGGGPDAGALAATPGAAAQRADVNNSVHALYIVAALRRWFAFVIGALHDRRCKARGVPLFRAFVTA